MSENEGTYSIDVTDHEGNSLIYPDANGNYIRWVYHEGEESKEVGFYQGIPVTVNEGHHEKYEIPTAFVLTTRDYIFNQFGVDLPMGQAVEVAFIIGKAGSNQLGHNYFDDLREKIAKHKKHVSDEALKTMGLKPIGWDAENASEKSDVEEQPLSSTGEVVAGEDLGDDGQAEQTDKGLGHR